MSRFVAVFHEWHVASRGFDQVALQAIEHEQAISEAATLLHQRDDKFYGRDFCLVELAETEHLPRRLTWAERITGRLA
jgi:hypothetical protein